LTNQLKQANKDPNKDQPNKLKNMGLGDLGSPRMIFVRTFRWTLEAPSHPKVNMWVQKFNANYKDKTVEIEAFEDMDGHVHEWITDIVADACPRNFIINHYDGCGNTIFTNTYSDIEIKEHKVEYDYSKSDVLTHKLKMSYRQLQRSSNLTIH